MKSQNFRIFFLNVRGVGSLSYPEKGVGVSEYDDEYVLLQMRGWNKVLDVYTMSDVGEGERGRGDGGCSDGCLIFLVKKSNINIAQVDLWDPPSRNISYSIINNCPRNPPVSGSRG